MACRTISSGGIRIRHSPNEVTINDLKNLETEMAKGIMQINIAGAAFNTPEVFNAPSSLFYIPNVSGVTIVRDGQNAWKLVPDGMGICAIDMVLRRIGWQFPGCNIIVSGKTNFWGHPI